MNDQELLERVVALETQTEILQENVKEVLSELKSITNTLTKYRGFLGGIWFIFGSLPIIWALGKGWIIGTWE